MIQNLFFGFGQDGLRLLVYLLALFYIIYLERCKKIDFKYRSALYAGIILLIFSGILDFTDEFRKLDNFALLGANDKLHDFFEDFVGSMLGFILFTIGILSKRK